jgi:hypothetical protein
MKTILLLQEDKDVMAKIVRAVRDIQAKYGSRKVTDAHVALACLVIVKSISDTNPLAVEIAEGWVTALGAPAKRTIQ